MDSETFLSTEFRCTYTILSQMQRRDQSLSYFDFVNPSYGLSVMGRTMGVDLRHTIYRLAAREV